jgi:hypothetical protein
MILEEIPRNRLSWTSKLARNFSQAGHRTYNFTEQFLVVLMQATGDHDCQMLSNMDKAEVFPLGHGFAENMVRCQVHASKNNAMVAVCGT